MTDKIKTMMLVGNVDADPELFETAVDYAWMNKPLEFAIVAVDTVIGGLHNCAFTDAQKRLLEIANEAKEWGISEVIFNRVETGGAA